MRNTIRKILVLVIACTIIAGAMPAFAENVKAIVAAETVNVYKDAYLQNYWGTLPAGTKVTVTGVSNGIARLKSGKNVGYCKSSALTQVQDEGPAVILTTKTTKKTRVYRAPSLKSMYVTVEKGTVVDVIGISGSCAMIRKDGKVGYMYIGYLEEYSTSSDEQHDTQYEDASLGTDNVSDFRSIEEMIASGKYSNEQIIFVFAVKNMGYNAAAAAALLSNIYSESSFNTGTVGDGGTSYGICQWHASRKTRLIDYCSDKGLDYTTLKGQLMYLKYELETYYPSVHKYMKGVADTAQGAYDAGYYFCYNFEAPANRVSRSEARGNRAKDTYYTKYAEYKV